MKYFSGSSPIFHNSRIVVFRFFIALTNIPISKRLIFS